MEKFVMPQLLLLAGTGRDSGKTLYGCRILSHWGSSHSIYTIKITPHFHKGIRSGRIIHDTEDIFIAEELSAGPDKDSKRFLEAGAKRSFFIMAQDEQLGDAMETLFREVPGNISWICESGGARHWVNPGLFLLITQGGIEEKKERNAFYQLADQKIVRTGTMFDIPAENIQIGENGWILKNT
ncbi:MAG: hypothetical protein U0T82_12670 [Bacteroidales bacterium]